VADRPDKQRLGAGESEHQSCCTTVLPNPARQAEPEQEATRTSMLSLLAPRRREGGVPVIHILWYEDDDG